MILAAELETGRQVVRRHNSRITTAKIKAPEPGPLVNRKLPPADGQVGPGRMFYRTARILTRIGSGLKEIILPPDSDQARHPQTDPRPVSDPDLPSVDRGPRPVSDQDLPSVDRGPRPVSDLDLPSVDMAPRPVSDQDLPSVDRGPRPVSDLDLPSVDMAPRPVSDLDLPSVDMARRPVSDLDLPSVDRARRPVSDPDLPRVDVHSGQHTAHSRISRLLQTAGDPPLGHTDYRPIIGRATGARFKCVRIT